MVPGFFQNCLCISIKNRMLATLNKFLIQFFDIGKIKITRHHQVFPWPITLTKIWVASGGTIRSRGSIAEVPHENLTPVVKVLLVSFRKFRKCNPILNHFFQFLVLTTKNFRQSLGARTPFAKHKSFTGRHI